MPRRKIKWKVGDIIQVDLGAEFAYLQLVGRLDYCDIVRVVDKRSLAPLSSTSEIRDAASLYWICTVCKVLMLDVRFRYIGNEPVDEHVPPLRRWAIGGGWIVKYDNRDVLVRELDDQLARVSIDEGVPAELIVRRLIGGWRPEHDRDNLFGVAQPDAGRAVNLNRLVRFFIDFPSALNAARAQRELKTEYRTVKSESPRTLVVSASLAGSDAVQSFEDVLARKCKSFGGEVSGRETSA